VDAVNPPMRILRTKDELAEKREADAAALAAQQQQQMLGGAADAYGKMTGAPEDGSPAAAMAEQAGV
jgi:hypothetical protein